MSEPIEISVFHITTGITIETIKRLFKYMARLAGERRIVKVKVYSYAIDDDNPAESNIEIEAPAHWDNAMIDEYLNRIIDIIDEMAYHAGRAR